MRPIPNREAEETERETAPVAESPEIDPVETEEADDDERWLDLHEF